MAALSSALGWRPSPCRRTCSRIRSCPDCQPASVGCLLQFLLKRRGSRRGEHPVLISRCIIFNSLEQDHNFVPAHRRLTAHRGDKTEAAFARFLQFLLHSRCLVRGEHFVADGLLCAHALRRKDKGSEQQRGNTPIAHVFGLQRWDGELSASGSSPSTTAGAPGETRLRFRARTGTAAQGHQGFAATTSTSCTVLRPQSLVRPQRLHRDRTRGC